MASSLAAEIKAKTGLEPELIEGAGGVFDVVADGTRLFSKHQVGRFPDAGEILSLLGV